MIAIVALALSTMAISLSWTGMKFPEMIIGLNNFDLMGGWSLSYYIIAEVAMMPLGGKLVDMYGPKSPLAGGLGLFLVGSAVAMFSQDSTFFLVGRIIQGLGAGLIFSVSMTSVGLLFEGHKMHMMHEIMTGTFAIGALFGLAFGFWISSNLGADNFVPICAMLTTAGGTVAYLYLPDAKPRGSHDRLGTLVITLFMLDICFFTQMVNNDFDLVSGETAAFVLTSVLLLVILYFVEKRAVDPIFPRTSESNLIGCILCMFLAGFCGLGIIQYLIRFLMIGMDMDVYETSAMFLIFLAGAAISSVCIEKVIGRTGFRRWVLIGPIIVFCGLMIASQTLTDGLVYVGISLFILGLGLGCIVTPALCSLHSSTKREALGSSTSIVLGFRFIGILTGVAVYEGIISWKLLDILEMIRELFGHASLELASTIMMLLGDVFEGGIDRFDESIMLCCLAAGILSLSIFAAAWFTIKPGFGKDEEKEE